MCVYVCLYKFKIIMLDDMFFKCLINMPNFIIIEYYLLFDP